MYNSRYIVITHKNGFYKLLYRYFAWMYNHGRLIAFLIIWTNCYILCLYILYDTRRYPNTYEWECTYGQKHKDMHPLCLDCDRSNLNFDTFCQINVDGMIGCHSYRLLIRDMNYLCIKVGPRASGQRCSIPRFPFAASIIN